LLALPDSYRDGAGERFGAEHAQPRCGDNADCLHAGYCRSGDADRIQDIQGRTVLVRELEGAAGRNVIELNVSELGGAAGVLSYTVTSGDFTATKKMVVVR
jgi:hypothetical protein